MPNGEFSRIGKIPKCYDVFPINVQIRHLPLNYCSFDRIIPVSLVTHFVLTALKTLLSVENEHSWKKCFVLWRLYQIAACNQLISYNDNNKLTFQKFVGLRNDFNLSIFRWILSLFEKEKHSRHPFSVVHPNIHIKIWFLKIHFFCGILMGHGDPSQKL